MSNADELVEELTLAVNDACSAWELGRHTLAHDRRIDAAKKAVVDALNAALRDSARLDAFAAFLLSDACTEGVAILPFRGAGNEEWRFGISDVEQGATDVGSELVEGNSLREAIDAAVAGSGLSDPERPENG